MSWTLLTNPLHAPADLGKPIPPLSHAVSVCLPTWQDVVDFEEQHPRMGHVLSVGYPRFVYAKPVLELIKHASKSFISQKEEAVVLVNSRAAARLDHYLEQHTGRAGRHELLCEDSVNGPVIYAYRRRCTAAVKAFWQHTGDGISTRYAEDILSQQVQDSDPVLFQVLKKRFADQIHAHPDDITLHGNGMQAIHTACRAVKHLTGNARTIQFGFPYVDSLKVQQQFGNGCIFYPTMDMDAYHKLKHDLSLPDVAAIITEIPSNPLLACPDLIRLRKLCDDHGKLLIVDDTVASTHNVDLSDVADMVTSSLTKFFSGVGNVVAGALTLHRQSHAYNLLKNAIAQEAEDTLYIRDARALEENSRDYAARMRVINDNAMALATMLENHPVIDQLYYPTVNDTAAYDAVKRPDGGYSGLMSFLVKEPERNAPLVYDALRVCKGPNLGANYTLCSAFTLLAHYHELDQVEALGVSRWLIRVSVGMEDQADLLARFESALAMAQS